MTEQWWEEFFGNQPLQKEMKLQSFSVYLILSKLPSTTSVDENFRGADRTGSNNC